MIETFKKPYDFNKDKRRGKPSRRVLIMEMEQNEDQLRSLRQQQRDLDLAELTWKQMIRIFEVDLPASFKSAHPEICNELYESLKKGLKIFEVVEETPVAPETTQPVEAPTRGSEAGSGSSHEPPSSATEGSDSNGSGSSPRKRAKRGHSSALLVESSDSTECISRMEGVG